MQLEEQDRKRGGGEGELKPGPPGPKIWMRIQILNPALMMYLHMPWHTKKLMLAYIFGPLLTCPSSVMISVLFKTYTYFNSTKYHE